MNNLNSILNMYNLCYSVPCTMTSSGEVTTYDGASGYNTLQLQPNTKNVVSKSETGDDDPCKFQVRAVADENVSFNIIIFWPGIL